MWCIGVHVNHGVEILACLSRCFLVNHMPFHKPPSSIGGCAPASSRLALRWVVSFTCQVSYYYSYQMFPTYSYFSVSASLRPRFDAILHYNNLNLIKSWKASDAPDDFDKFCNLAGTHKAGVYIASTDLEGL